MLENDVVIKTNHSFLMIFTFLSLFYYNIQFALFIFLMSSYLRFWKQGYWRNHLQGRSYHISALYVVDLKRFRRIAAGDRLRGQYQALSQDPNSLSNLGKSMYAM